MSEEYPLEPIHIELSGESESGSVIDGEETGALTRYASRFAEELQDGLVEAANEGGMVARSNFLHDVLEELDKEPDKSRKIISDAVVMGLWKDGRSVNEFFSNRVVPGLAVDVRSKSVSQALGDFSVAVGMYADVVDHPESAVQELPMVLRRIENAQTGILASGLDEEVKSRLGLVATGFKAGIEASN